MAYCQRIKRAVSAEITVKGSKFIAYAEPVGSVAAIEAHIEALRQEHHKARHHCYAWRLGPEGEEYRANDDGEPSGTAGLPIYNQLLSFDVSDCLIVVVRYFGGTLLGAPGLIRAYKQASLEALEQAYLSQIIPKTTFSVSLPYQAVNELMQSVEHWQMRIIDQKMDMPCRYILECRRDDYELIIDQFTRTEITLIAD
ncbi:YigZ family protein [Suttonella sp. R2A3]|uniref:IMPACT family protein n=1 Tax=Suttonella sp. R2A3 TaxID=2908648 RepID=UPI001F1F94AE|nr:YigZ family protein [Suttonella sp. R2A3]UJF24755.1 YigZ family protein [Suttonella sp. R2A3]